MKKAWNSWVRIVRFVVGIQTSIILFVIYYLIILPMALCLKIFSKDSLVGHGHFVKKDSFWIMREKVKQNITWAKAQ